MRVWLLMMVGGIDVPDVDADVLGEQLVLDFKRTGQKGRLSFSANYEHLADRSTVTNREGEYNSRNARQRRHRAVHHIID